MDNLDDSENTAKISDSAYSNSCSNSQSRRSHSSKSTHSGSHSSGSSGYGGKPPSGCSNNPGLQQKKEKDSKKKKQTPVVTLTSETQAVIECMPPEPKPVDILAPPKESPDVVQTPLPAQTEAKLENLDLPSLNRSAKEEFYFQVPNNVQQPSTSTYVGHRPSPSASTDGFSCVISMHDGVVMYTTSSLTSTLGFPKDMWIGRSFIHFVHPRDRNTFASQITNGLAVPKIEHGTQKKAKSPSNSESTIVCRIREYRGLSSSFGVKDLKVNFMPFLLRLTFKNISDEEGKVIYLVIQATPIFSAFKLPNEIIMKPVPFVMRHAANGNLEYIDSESVPYLGYLPQDLIDKDALNLYHPDDLAYLRQVYETIVKEGGLARSKTYRMMSQNSDYIKVETEWSSFINPWSKKLEFVIGKHHIIEGPINPDVFQNPDPERPMKFSEEKLNKAQALRDSIIRIMNEVLTKPAEIAKQQMSKRCQDFATFMESLMEEPTKTDDELRLEIQEPDHSYYEPDSVMLGGISPHHEYNDSMSSTETPLSYTQLNYNETLCRYFTNHQPYSYDEYKTVAGENVLGMQGSKPMPGPCLSPMAEHSGVSGDITSSCDSNVGTQDAHVGPIGDYPPVRLTETLIAKHNSEMEKELMRSHRECRSSGKGEREKASNETRQKKKEHLARCNASFQPTVSHAPSMEPQFVQPHGVKRPAKHAMNEVPHKHHCPSRLSRRRHNNHTDTTPPPPSTPNNAIHNNPWLANQANNMNTFILGVGIPQQMSLMNPMQSMPGMFPMYYSPTSGPSGSTFQNPNETERLNNQPQQCQVPALQCMMYGQAVYGQPLMYSPMAHQMPHPVQQPMMGLNNQYASLNALELTSSNYEEACKVTIPTKSTKPGAWQVKKSEELQPAMSKTIQGSGESSTSTSALNRSTEAVTDTNPSGDDKSKTDRLGNSDEQVDRTDVGSSYSSFYSSFFKTESGSAEESSDARKSDNRPGTKNKQRFWNKLNRGDGSVSSRSRIYSSEAHTETRLRPTGRVTESPWMEQVNMTPDLMFKYQVASKNIEEVLNEDRQRMKTLPQPNLVNDQLGQLYLDLQLEGQAARLTLEEGITSSSSSGEENNERRVPRRKREYSKLVIIYEEDAPLPPHIDTD